MSKNGATGHGPAKSKTSGSQLQVHSATNGHGLHNGHNGHIEQDTASIASPTPTTPPTGSKDNGLRRQPRCSNGTSHLNLTETAPVIKMLYCELLSLAGVEKGDVKEFEISEPSMKRLTNRKLICKIVELSTEYIKTSEREFESFIDEFRTVGLEVTFSTMYAEFRSVLENLFNDGINFGRVLSFLRFSAAYAVFVYRKGMKKAVPSVEAWTVEVIERDLGDFFAENKGWVSYCNSV